MNDLICIPRRVDGMHLSVYAFRLYVHIKGAADRGGVCLESTAELSAACDMSAGSVSKAKDDLAKAGLIQVTTHQGTHGEFDRHYITICECGDAIP